MRNKLKIYITFFSILTLVLFSCDNGGDSNGNPTGNRRNVRFEVSGNYTGFLSVSYITASGGGTAETISALPWTKSVQYQTSVPSTAISVAGTGGVSGQTLTVKVFSGDVEVSSTPVTAMATGQIAASAPSLVF